MPKILLHQENVLGSTYAALAQLTIVCACLRACVCACERERERGIDTVFAGLGVAGVLLSPAPDLLVAQEGTASRYEKLHRVRIQPLPLTHTHIHTHTKLIRTLLKKCGLPICV